MKTLIPKNPERKIIDGLTFIAAKSGSYVYLAKESLTKEIYIDGLKLDEDERKKDIAIISNQTEIKVINSLTNDVKIYKYLK